MDTMIRFFISKSEECIAQLKCINSEYPIPYIGTSVDLQGIVSNEQYTSLHLDFDYYVVKNIMYTYTYSSTIVDVFVTGDYYEECARE